MKRFLILLVLCVLSSCDFFASKDKKTFDLVNKELKDIDWSEVDNYPLFDNCDETVSKALQRYCFEQEMLSHCRKALQEFEFNLGPSANPEVLVDFVVDLDGRISVVQIQKDEAIDDQMPKFEKRITQAIQNIPPLGPALKRGIPVKSKFRIPILLSTKEESTN